MNVIVSNKQKEIIDNANIDAIKDLTGLFNVDDLIAKFKNYFFSKMILDVTSVENFTSREVLQKLVDGIGSDRLIILLPETPPPPDEFKKMLIDLKIYNFSNHIDDVVKFIDNPNTYESVLRDMGDSVYSDSGYVDNSIKGGNNNNQISDIGNNQEINNSFGSSASLQDALDSFNIRESGNPLNNDLNVESDNQFVPITDDNNSFNGMNSDEYNINDDNQVNDDTYPMPSLNDLLGPSNVGVSEDKSQFDTGNNSFNSMEIGGNTVPNNMSLSDLKNDSSNNAYSDVNNSQVENNDNYLSSNINGNSNQSGNVFLNINGLNNVTTNSKQIIGFRNVTNHAGSTTLIYMLLKTLTGIMRKDAIAIEINSDDFKLFMNNRMVSIQEKDINDYLASRYEKVILVDLNDCKDTSFCNDIVYLVEPSTIMLNKLMVVNQNIFRELSGKKVVLNKSMLLPKDVSILANEAGINFIYNLRPLNDRINNDEILKFISVLGVR